MNRELIINVTPTEITIALCEDKVLVGLSREQTKTGFAVGDIYLGKVHKIMPGLNAAFIDIGHERDAFIHYQDLGTHFPTLNKIVGSYAPGHRGLRLDAMKIDEGLAKEGRIGDVLQVGQSVMVQIVKEAISTKGPRLTADISLAGRNVVLVPFSSKVFISQKIRSSEDKKRVKRVAMGVLPKNFGVIIRTAAASASDIDIEQDIVAMVERWNQACAQIRKSDAPMLLMSELSRANTIIRDNLDGSFSQICINDDAIFEQVCSYVRAVDPEKAKIVKRYTGTLPIFDNFDITRQIKSLFAKYVSLRRGAYLIIESTEAMNVIDVNSGNRTKAEENQEQTALDVNLAAAAEIARQLRLRDMGGIVIIDFIDMHKAQSRQLLYEQMCAFMADDKAKHTILPLSKFGLMQITRQRIRPIAITDTRELCPTCGGTGKIEPTVALESKIENQISFLAKDRKHRYIKLVVSPYVAAFLTKGLLSPMRRWMWRYKTRIVVSADQSVGIVDILYHDKRGRDLLSMPVCNKNHRR